jgi:hypothetical protein
MKKRLEAELISIAHRVLKLKNKSEVNQLYHETQKLYEALAVLKFYGDNYEQIKSDIIIEDLEEKVGAFVDKKTAIETPIHEVTETISVNETVPTEPKVREEPQLEEEFVIAMEESIIEEELVIDEEIENEPTALEEEKENEEESVIVGEITLEEDEIEEDEEPKSDFDFEPIFELAAESPIEDIVEEKTETPKQETKQISFEDLLGENYTEPVFVKPNDIASSLKNLEDKPLSLNEQHSKTINIGLNDRIAFVKHLFGESNEDFNRVLSQLNTFSSFEEARDFIVEIIKPDYNNWLDKDEYTERFLEFVENKFS